MYDKIPRNLYVEYTFTKSDTRLFLEGNSHTSGDADLVRGPFPL